MDSITKQIEVELPTPHGGIRKFVVNASEDAVGKVGNITIEEKTTEGKKVLISFITEDNIADVALDDSLSLFWWKDTSKTMSVWRMEELLEKEKELKTIKEAFAILSNKE